MTKMWDKGGTTEENSKRRNWKISATVTVEKYGATEQQNIPKTVKTGIW